MKINSMFEREITRKINGVIKVEQHDDEALKQELDEYVVTKELRRHFTTFLENYSNSITTPTDKIGVWISGFFGSGKSHFLKMLSYILGNKEVGGRQVVDYFKEKFNDAMLEAQLTRCVSIPTESILFNIDNVNKGEKDGLAIRRIILQEFHNHLGFYGADPKIANLEQYITKQGKMDEFKAEIKRLHGDEWEEYRGTYAFLEDVIVEALQNTLNMSEESARKWFENDQPQLSVDEIVGEIKKYVDSKGDSFRLLFCIDEVGQFIGDNKDLMLNLQSFVEGFGSKCRGKVWIMVTSQEAIDSVTKVITDDFSKIMARWDTKLSLSSSSADEVIKKRILQKNNAAEDYLKLIYDKNNSALKNLFTFENAKSDIKGYNSCEEFVATFPFIPYQFTMLQKVFTEIRTHGFSIKHLSSGERSMISGFKDAAESIKEKDENALAPFHLFYGTVSTVIDSTIRRVMERAQTAANNGDGLEECDVATLKLLFLIRYIDNDIAATLDNITILSISKTDEDKIKLRNIISASLERLEHQNYILHESDRYMFLTDEEQDTQQEIRGTIVDNADVVRKISDTIFDEIYPSKKITVSKTPFTFGQYIDDTAKSANIGGIRLQFYTNAGRKHKLAEEAIKMHSYSNKAVIVVLSNDESYYEDLLQAEKIYRYAKQKNQSSLSAEKRKIIQNRQTDANQLTKNATKSIENAILNGTFYVYGDKVDMKSASDVKSLLNKMMEVLIEKVYTKLNYVNDFIENDNQIGMILSGPQTELSMRNIGLNNENALDELSMWLEAQNEMHRNVSMAEIQKVFHGEPFGWREIDIAGLVARLVVMQKIDVRYGGTTIAKGDKQLPILLRNKTEIERISISRRIAPTEELRQQSNKFLHNWLSCMDIPNDEDGLIQFVNNTFQTLRDRYEKLLNNYTNTSIIYPEKNTLEKALALINNVLSQKNNNVALLKRLIEKQDELLDMTEDTEQIEKFFKTQKSLFDEAYRFCAGLKNDLEYFEYHNEAKEKYKRIMEILSSQKPYSSIKDIANLMMDVKEMHNELLKQKRENIHQLIDKQKEEIRSYTNGNDKTEQIVTSATNELDKRATSLNTAKSLTELDAITTRLYNFKDSSIKQIDIVLSTPIANSPDASGTPIAVPTPRYVKLQRYDILPAKRLSCPEEVDEYVQSIKDKLLAALNESNGDGIQIL